MPSLLLAKGLHHCDQDWPMLSFLHPLQVKQLELVRDVLRVVQGLTGRYCYFNPAAAAGNLALTGPALVVARHDRLTLQVGYRTLLHELGELGLMYRWAFVLKSHQPHTCERHWQQHSHHRNIVLLHQYSAAEGHTRLQYITAIGLVITISI